MEIPPSTLFGYSMNFDSKNEETIVEVIEEFEEIIGEEEDEEEALNREIQNKYLEFLYARDYEGAKFVLTNCPEIKDNIISFHLEGIHQNFKEGKIKDARDETIAVLNVFPIEIKILTVYFRILFFQREMELTSQTLDKLLELGGKNDFADEVFRNEQFLLDCAICLERQDRCEEAAQFLESFIQKALGVKIENSPAMLATVMGLCYRLGWIDELSRIVETHYFSKNTTTHSGLKILLTFDKKSAFLNFQSSISFFLKNKDKDKNKEVAEFFGNAGYLSLLNNQEGEAIGFFKKAFSKDPVKFRVFYLFYELFS